MKRLFSPKRAYLNAFVIVIAMLMVANALSPVIPLLKDVIPQFWLAWGTQGSTLSLLTSVETSDSVLANNWQAQTFQVSTDSWFYIASIWLYNTGSKSYTVSLRTATTVPTGSDIVSNTTSYNMGSVYGWANFTFTSTFITASANYAIVVTPSPYWRYDSSNPYSDGGYAWSADGSAWYVLSPAVDAQFRVYGYDDITGGVTVTITNPQSTTYTGVTVPVTLSATTTIGSIDKIWYNCLNGSSWIYGSNQTYTSSTYMTGINTGTYTFWAFANDTTGNNGSSSVTFSVAASSLIITITNPLNYTYTNTFVPVVLSTTGSGTVDKRWFNCKNGSSWIYANNITYTGSTQMTGFTVGVSYQFWAWANDTVGTTASSSIMFSVYFTTPNNGAAAQIQSLAGNVSSWTADLETMYAGLSLGTVTLSQFQAALDDNTADTGGEAGVRWQGILYWYTVLRKFGVENQTTIEWALNNATMLSNGLPQTASNYFLVHDRFLIWGYYWASKFSYLESKWNCTAAFNAFNSTIYSYGKPALWVYDDNTADGIGYGPRYYDETCETLDVYLEFYVSGLVLGAITDAVHWWNWMNNHLWNVNHYNYAVSWADYECEGGAMEEVIWKLYYYEALLGNISRMFTDLSTRFLANQWLSPQWCYAEGYSNFVVTHKYQSNPDLRFPSTIFAWASILGAYDYITSPSDISAVQQMMDGSSPSGLSKPAWFLLEEQLNRQGLGTGHDLYVPASGKFRWTGSGSVTDDATANAAALTLALSVSPITGAFAVPLEDYRYEYYSNIIDCGMWKIDFTTHSMLLPIIRSGTFNFMLGNVPFTYTLGSTGLLNVTFASDWNSITSYSVSSLPTRAYFGTTISQYLPGSINSQPVGISFYLNDISYTTPYSGSFPSGIANLTFPLTYSISGLLWNFNSYSDGTTNNTNLIDFNVTSSIAAYYTSQYAPLNYTGYQPVLAMAMNNMFELDGLLEGNDTYRQMLLDTSPYNNHAKIYPLTYPYAGPTITWGNIGQALLFDGVDDTAIAIRSSSLNFTEGMSIDFWFRPINGTSKQYIFSMPESWGVGIENHKMFVEIVTSSDTEYTAVSNVTINDGIMAYFAMTYDFTTAQISIYIQSIIETSYSTDGLKIRTSSSNLYIGSYDNSTGFYKGVIDEVRIYPYDIGDSKIYDDASTAITRFDTFTFVNSGLSDTRGSHNYTVVEGMTSGYQHFINNDPDLPSAYANSTMQESFVRTLKYVAGFSQYQMYCDINYETNAGSPDGDSEIKWYWNFFKNGILQVSYTLQISPIGGGSGYVDQWKVWFYRTTPYYGNQTLKGYSFDVNATLFPHTIPIIMTAWIGPDSKHFTARLDFQDSRVVTGTTWLYGVEGLPFVYSFDMIDSEANIHDLSWFDGWVVTGIKAEADASFISGIYTQMEISGHKSIWSTINNAYNTVAGWVSNTGNAVWSGLCGAKDMVWNGITGAYSYAFGGADAGTIIDNALGNIPSKIVTEVKEVLTYVYETTIAAVTSGYDYIVNAFSGLSHDILGGFGSLQGWMSGVLAPLWDWLGGISKSIWGGMITYISPLLAAIWNGAQWLFTPVANVVLVTLQGIWSSIATLFNWIGAALGFGPSSFTNAIAAVVAAFSALATFVLQIPTYLAFAANFLTATLSYVITALGWIWGIMTTAFTMIAIVWGYLTGALGIVGAWLLGSSYSAVWGITYNFTNLSTIHYLGFSGGLSIVMLCVVIYFFMSFAYCFMQMSLEPILAPLRFGWSIFNFAFTLFLRFANFAIRIANLLRNLSPI